MANMPYCRFHNTVLSFQDCLRGLMKAESFTDMDLSLDENHSMNYLAVLARRYLNRYTELQEQAEYEFARNMDDGA